MEETKQKIIRSDEYKAKNREISLRRYYEKKGKEYKPRSMLTDDEKNEIAYQGYLKNKERALARYYRLKGENAPVKEEKVLTPEQIKAKEYFKKYYQENKEKYINLKINKKIFKTTNINNDDTRTVVE